MYFKNCHTALCIVLVYLCAVNQDSKVSILYHCLITYINCSSDSLVQHFQLIHDGHLPGGSGEHDPDAHTSQGLCSLQQGGRP